MQETSVRSKYQLALGVLRNKYSFKRLLVVMWFLCTNFLLLFSAYFEQNCGDSDGKDESK